MAKLLTHIDSNLKEWIQNQKIFFVGSAPLSKNGHVNISPKGCDSFRIIDEFNVAYNDLTGSGIETASHVQENKRLVIMFCSFSGPPQIIRLHGIGEVIKLGDPHFNNLRSIFPFHMGTRLIIKLNIKRISSSCGYSIPYFDYVGERDVLDKWTEAKGESGLADYRKNKNSFSIDGLKGI